MRISILLAGLVLFGCKTSDSASPESSVANVPVDRPALDCSLYQPEGDAKEWLLGIRSQLDLKNVFLCSSVPENIPTGTGKGNGSVLAGLAIWNQLQANVGSVIWGGKVFEETDTGEIVLKNIMTDSDGFRYNARVYKTMSTIDGKPTIVLDYRIDDSRNTYGPPATPAQIAVDSIARGIRDEIREIQKDGVGTGVYVGRANLAKAYAFTLARPDLTDRQFDSPNTWIFAANFFLDFRQ